MSININSDMNEYLIKKLLALQPEEEFYLAIVNPKTMTREYEKIPKIRYYGYLESDTNSAVIVKFKFNSDYNLTSDCDLLDEDDYKIAKDDIVSGKATIIKNLEFDDYRISIYLFTEFSYKNEILVEDDSDDDNIYDEFIDNLKFGIQIGFDTKRNIKKDIDFKINTERSSV